MADTRLPWTREELKTLIPAIDRELTAVEFEYNGNVKPLPPMTTEDCLDLFFGMLRIAGERALTSDECFLHGQLLSCYRMAIIAEALGKKGRYFVVSEEQLGELMNAQNAKL